MGVDSGFADVGFLQVERDQIPSVLVAARKAVAGLGLVAVFHADLHGGTPFSIDSSGPLPDAGGKPPGPGDRRGAGGYGTHTRQKAG